MRELYLSDNQLTELPTEFGELANLSELDLLSNQFTLFPSALLQVKTLSSLRISNNQIISLPGEIENLTQLHLLEVSANQLSELPEEIGTLNELSHLYLHNNPASAPLPDSITTLSLNEFTFYDTEWCEPNTVVFQDWLFTVGSLHGTGRICGQPGGTIQGTVILEDKSPARAAPITLYRDHGVTVANVTTDNMGNFTVEELGRGINYYIYFPAGSYFPEYYEDQLWPEDNTAVTVTLGMTTTITATLSVNYPVYLPAIQGTR